jgi:hypothetical protein
MRLSASALGVNVWPRRRTFDTLELAYSGIGASD